jgi:hypothetical protein
MARHKSQKRKNNNKNATYLAVKLTTIPENVCFSIYNKTEQHLQRNAELFGNS